MTRRLRDASFGIAFVTKQFFLVGYLSKQRDTRQNRANFFPPILLPPPLTLSPSPSLQYSIFDLSNLEQARGIWRLLPLDPPPPPETPYSL